MILRELKRERVKDGRLWEMIDQANKLTAGSSYESWDDNIVGAADGEDSAVRTGEGGMGDLFW